MNQINFLSQDLIKTADNKADSSGVESRSQGRDDSFSSLVEQHSQNDPRNKTERQSNKSGNSTGNLAGNEGGNRAADKSVKDVSRPKDSSKAGEPVEPAEQNAEPVAREASETDNQVAKEAENVENTEPGTNGKPDKAKDPQSLIDLLGASAKLLQQQVMGEGAGKQELTGDVNIDADLLETSSGETSVLAKLKGLVSQPTSAKEINVQLEGQAVEGENLEGEGSEAETLIAEQAAKQANKAQTSAQDAELLAKLKGGEAEAATKDKAGQLEAPLSDKKLSPQELMAKAQQALAAELNAKAAAGNGDNETGEAGDDVLMDKTFTAGKVSLAEGDISAKKSIQVNKAPGDATKGGGAAALAQSAANNPSPDQAVADIDPAVGDNIAVADTKAAALQNQGGTENHRPLGLAAEHGGQGTGSQGGSEQGKNNGNQSGQQPSSAEALMAKEETSQAQQHKVATTPLKEQSVLAAQMNNSALANSETPQAHNSEHVLDSVATKVNAENLQTQKNNLTTLNEALNLRKDFAGPMKEKVMIMINQKIQQVEIRLDPPELGNMHVRVNLQNEQAAVNFLVQSQQAKEALEQGMGKLKDMLSESGVDVGDANVAQQQQGSGDNEQGFGHDQQGNGRENHGLEQPELVMQASFEQGTASGVDYYA
ncbi:flagellar hook-length control protein FliK [Thalassomonas actiniarum]|uniref:Flagellar hook-length control protein FliK n=1 Tax=Thalassomonas actiniarum TaxID=485447 RepID=A0AAF0C4Y3_9GAMM|nr:flagellar hook-length control protein FliK [Thalassomonas actiniarum]WDE00494.1 flagellar hook-length control protein FliK [Thalassomonas actiniarum]